MEQTLSGTEQSPPPHCKEKYHPSKIGGGKKVSPFSARKRTSPVQNKHQHLCLHCQAEHQMRNENDIFFCKAAEPNGGGGSSTPIIPDYAPAPCGTACATHSHHLLLCQKKKAPSDMWVGGGNGVGGDGQQSNLIMQFMVTYENC